MKILGDGELKIALTVRAHAFSKSAQEKIAQAGGNNRSSEMRKLLEAFRNIFSTPDLRKRVLFALALLAVYRLGQLHSHAGNQYRRCSSSFSSSTRARRSAFSIFSAAAIFAG